MGNTFSIYQTVDTEPIKPGKCPSANMIAEENRKKLLTEKIDFLYRSSIMTIPETAKTLVK